MLRPVRKLLHDTLNAVRAAMGTLDPATKFIGLYTAITGPADHNRVLADLTEATYTGYARQAIGSWTDAYDSTTGLILITADNKHFTPSDAVAPNTIIGWFVADAVTGGALLAIEPLASPVPLANADNTLTVEANFGFLPTGNFGEGSEIS